MGTRGAYGFVLNGREIATYNHYDSYPEGLGVEVLGFVSETPDEELRQIAQGIELVDESFKPSKEQVEACKEWTDLGVSNQSVEDWYCLLRKAQGNFLALKNGLRYMIDSSTFLLDSLFCEWAYLINLDTGKLEVYEGFNKNPLAAGRYAQFTVDRELRYYGVALLDEVPFEEARKLTADQFVERLRGEVKVDE